MMGNFGGGVSPLVVTYVLSLTNNSWNVNFYMFAAVYGVGALCWFFIDPVTPLESQKESSAAASG